MAKYTVATLSNTRGLASAILLQAVHDYKTLRPNNVKKKKNLDEFFDSSWFYQLCDACELDAELVKNKVTTGSFTIPVNNLRAARR